MEVKGRNGSCVLSVDIYVKQVHNRYRQIMVCVEKLSKFKSYLNLRNICISCNHADSAKYQMKDKNNQKQKGKTKNVKTLSVKSIFAIVLLG